jgi:pimeloyl-ACP methyl ester carboxylesterase
MAKIYRTPEGGEIIRERYRQILGFWPAPSEQMTIATSQGETFVMACGDRRAPPLVLLHGSGSNSAVWIGDVPAWSAHFRLYAIDLIGEPGLSAPSRPPLAGGAHAAWLGEVLDGLGVSTAALVGVSLGGWMALDFATRAPERVDRLVLVCPGGIGRQRPGFGLKAMTLLMLGPWGRRMALRAALGSRDVDPRVADYLSLIFTHFIGRRDKLPIFDDAALRRLTMPTLLIVGGEDAMLDSADTRARLEARAPRVTTRFLPEVGHMITGQTDAILAFLREAG